LFGELVSAMDEFLKINSNWTNTHEGKDEG
jgi:hypothetical protein